MKKWQISTKEMTKLTAQIKKMSDYRLVERRLEIKDIMLGKYKGPKENIDKITCEGIEIGKEMINRFINKFKNN